MATKEQQKPSKNPQQQQKPQQRPEERGQKNPSHSGGCCGSDSKSNQWKDKSGSFKK